MAGWAIPAALERIAMRALATYPEDRYPSVAAMREELVRFVRGEIDLPRALFHAGATIVREGDDGDAAYLVLSGSCEVVAGGDGRPSRVAVLGPGEVLGEAALARRPHAASVVAIARTEVMVITRDALESELGGQKPWVRALLRSLAHRVTR